MPPPQAIRNGCCWSGTILACTNSPSCWPAAATPRARNALADNLPTSGLAVIDFDIEHWGDVAFRRGRLELFVSPKLLKAGLGG